ncbi:SAP30-binding protein isoform X1 [Canis lupus baileyi]|uniref:SAP30-binding protein isoform X1 n=1 Tax=Canis lupus familiaris TaxID=9615 RepID=UPI0015F16187|nr:SAP30-binding protein isoform X1 [Canis lupus familiaris]XP_038531641.1 SAP30-binding protein isoform X1 [Canis lupus familiaris]
MERMTFLASEVMKMVMKKRRMRTASSRKMTIQRLKNLRLMTQRIVTVLSPPPPTKGERNKIQQLVVSTASATLLISMSWHLRPPDLTVCKGPDVPPARWGRQDNPEVEKRDPQELVASFSERVRNMSPDEIKIPPEPPGRCSNHLQDKIQKLYERKIKEGMDMNYIIQRKKEFRNPSIYEKLIQFCAIDELGTNYPKDMFDPHGWSEDSYYEALAKAQKIEMDKLEKAKKERTKIEFVTGTKKGTTTNATATTTTTASTAVADAQKRKSKWDSAIPVTTIAQPTILTTTATLPAVVTVTTSASGSKTTVISAVGTIVKKAKQ